ncbi:MAG: FAD-binding oxidoreductase [Planctomycetota bacterium]|nr:MAG: FAD-binding oxidoreductase [Planctomycetota bacterium]
MSRTDAGQSRDRARQALARDVARLVRGDVRFGRHDRMLYATDASLYQVEPVGVVIPQDVEDAARVVRFCAARGVAVLPRGGGTSLAGQCVNEAVVIDFSPNCRAVGEIDAGAGRVRVEPGVCLDALNGEIARRGHRLFFAPDVATSRHATIGGMIGNNSAGARSVRYGRTVDHVESLDVMLLERSGEARRATLGPDAAGVEHLAQRIAQIVQRSAPVIRERFPTIVRRNSGYALDLILDQLDAGRKPDTLNLAPIVCGSEGTLAVTLGATLRLTPTPVARGLVVASFASMGEAVAAVNPILATAPSAVELLDETVLRLAARSAEHAGALDLLPRVRGRSPAAALFIEHTAEEDARELDSRFEALRGALAGAPVARVIEAGAVARAWALRKAAEPLLHGLPGLRKPITFVEDTAVDPARLPEFVERFSGIVAAHGTSAAFYAHASVGCLHVRPLLNPADPADRDRLRAIATAVADLVREFGGSLSGEHGDGRVRGPLLERFFGPELVRAFGAVKAAFDPAGLLNPGVIADPGPPESITERLRVLPAQRPIVTPQVETFFDYSDQHGFDGAVHMCNGAGVCRKTSGGTMCPSYMATLDERHSTRGRGNALRLAITGQFGDTPGRPAWADAQTARTLDLCLSCKACARECPSHVDIARLKAEFAAQRRASGGRTALRDRLLARVRDLNRLGAAAPGLANAAARWGVTRGLINRALGLAPARSLPAFGRPQTQVRKTPPPSGAERAVGLVIDCFTGFGESEIGADAVRALGAVGCTVRLIDAGCCQRPAVSLGLLDRASTRGARFMGAIADAAARGPLDAVLFLEPSCLSAAIDDLPKLTGPAAQRARRGAPMPAVGAPMMLAEDYLADRLAEKPSLRVSSPAGPDVLFHGHCHQKALLGPESGARLLRALIGDRVKPLDAGCCGMAGAFGMTRDRFDLSMVIGGLALFPAVRANPGAIVAASGASCRHQILDGTGRRARHPVQFAADILCPVGDHQEGR